MDYGIKVSEEGYDVKTAADKNLILKSGQTLFKVLAQGVISGGAPNQTIAHNLGYEPQFLVWIDDGSGIKDAGPGLATGMDTFGTAKVDDTNLYINAKYGTNNARYYIFYEPLNTGTAPTVASTNDYGIIISKDGVDVKEANILQQTFNSEKNSMKIALTGQSSDTVNTTKTFLLAHGLSVIPGYLIYFEVDGSGKWWSENEQDTLSGKSVLLNSWTTSTQLVASLTSSASCTVKIKYFVFADEGG